MLHKGLLFTIVIGGELVIWLVFQWQILVDDSFAVDDDKHYEINSVNKAYNHRANNPATTIESSTTNI